MRKRDAGFSLIELIIVIAILAVLVALVAPQYFQYVERSRKGVCENNRAEAERMYSVLRSDPEETVTGRELMKKALLLTEAKAEGAVYTGLCPGGGRIHIKGTEEEPYLACDKHSEMIANNDEAAKEMAKALEGIGTNKTIYSGVVNKPPYTEFMEAVSSDVKEYLEGKSWTINWSQGSYNIAIYDGDVSTTKTGEQIDVDIYNISSGVMSKGKRYVGTTTVNEEQFTVITTY